MEMKNKKHYICCPKCKTLLDIQIELKNKLLYCNECQTKFYSHNEIYEKFMKNFFFDENSETMK